MPLIANGLLQNKSTSVKKAARYSTLFFICLNLYLTQHVQSVMNEALD